MKPRNNRWAARLFSNWHQKVIALVAALFIFIFYRLSTQQEIPVPLEVTRPAGFELAREWPEEVRLIFRGGSRPEKLSEDDFRAVVDLSAFPRAGTVKGAVRIESRRENLDVKSLEFEYSPSVIEFALEPVLEKYVALDAKAGVTGVLPPGYFLESITFYPQHVLVRGPESQVKRVTRATTEPFDLTGRKGPLSGSLKIFTGNKFVKPADAAEVKVSAVIRGRRTFDQVGLVYNGLRAELSIRESPRGAVEVEGTERVIESLKPEELSLAVDCREIAGPGEFELPVARPELPAAFAGEGKILSYEPKTVTLRFERRDKEAPR